MKKISKETLVILTFLLVPGIGMLFTLNFNIVGYGFIFSYPFRLITSILCQFIGVTSVLMLITKNYSKEIPISIQIKRKYGRELIEKYVLTKTNGETLSWTEKNKIDEFINSEIYK